MLSPDRNESPKRGWMLAAAAVAALALVGGLVLATTGSDDDPTPADTPVATLPAEPAPDAEADPDSEAVVVPAPEPTTAAEVAPEPEPEPATEPVTVTLTGTFSMTKEFTTVPSRSGLVGDQMWVADTRFEGQLSASAYNYGQVWNLTDGSSYEYVEGDMTATIDGLGVGALNYRGTAQTVDGVWSSEMVIASGTAAFEGASGTLILTPDPATPGDSTTGTYEWTITVPPTGSLETVTATGTAELGDVTSEPGERPDELVSTEVLTFDGSMVGTAQISQTTWSNGTTRVGSNTTEFTGTIDGIGTGTMTMSEVLTVGPDGYRSTVIVTGGTGDLEGITGTGSWTIADSIGYEFFLAVPVTQ